MRLWHKSMINVLPREQLVSQWREGSAIAARITKNGTPNHILVNKILDYSIDHFITYMAVVRTEMTARGYRTMDKVWDKIIACAPNGYKSVPFNELFSSWMNDTYWIICYYNLKEKWLCKGISDFDWQKIEEADEKWRQK